MNTDRIEGQMLNPIEDQRAQALKHYEEASSAIHHWSSFVDKAIKSYNPIPPNQQGRIDLLAKSSTTPPFPDRMTFREFFDTLFNRDFMNEQEFGTICDAAEMYANGCLKNASSLASGEGERLFTLDELKDAFCYTYDNGKCHPGNNRNKDLRKYFKEKFNIDI